MRERKIDLKNIEKVIAKERTAYWYKADDWYYISDSHFILRCTEKVFAGIKKKLDARKRTVEWRELPLLQKHFNIDGILCERRKSGKLPDGREVLVLFQPDYQVVIDRMFLVQVDESPLYYTSGRTKPVYQIISDELVNMILPINNPEVLYD